MCFTCQFPVLKTQSVQKVDTRLEKMSTRHLSLSARVTVANGLILSSLWYILTLWSGDLEFFNKIQKKIADFVWAGRPRVDRGTITQSKAHGGLGLISIVEQYRALAGGIMVWTLGPDLQHPLRRILREHLMDLSVRKWGTPDLTWVVTPGGSSESKGSPAWRNVCKAWGSLKPLLRKVEPKNIEEWRLLPLWRPHCQHITDVKVKCISQAQQRLRESGLSLLGDILHPAGQCKEWEELNMQIGDANGRRAYQALIDNIRPVPQFDPVPGPHKVFFAEPTAATNGRIWQFEVHQQDISSSWPRIREFNLPICTYLSVAGAIQKTSRSIVPALTPLHRVLIRAPRGQENQRWLFGVCSP